MKQKAIELLNSAHLRQTQPRVAILNALLASGAPVTQEQIAEQIGTSAPNKNNHLSNADEPGRKGPCA